MKEGTIDSLRVREKAVMPELDVLRSGEDPSHMEYQPCCGDCCWFCEDSHGDGMCALHRYDGDELPWYNESLFACSDITTRREMRHHMAVLLQWKRYMSDRSELTLYKPVRDDDLHKAQDFSFRYMKVFSNL